MSATGSLQRRLLFAAALWIGCALAAAAVVQTLLFRRHVEAELAERMQAHLQELVAALQAEPGGRLALKRPLTEPGFQQPLGGLYWLVRREGGNEPLLASRSLWDHALALPAVASTAVVQRLTAPGPRGQSLVLWARRVELPGEGAPLQVLVGADASRLDALTRSYARTLAASLAVVALALLAAAALQVRLGLAPLRRLHAALQGFRAGRSPRLDGRYPREVQPLVDDLHALLDENAAIVERSRTQTGNLAHALKTPLAVITHAAERLPGPDGVLVHEQALRMAAQVELQLLRARAAAHASRKGAGSAAAPVAEALQRALERLHAERGVALALDVQGSPRFAGDARDLQDMLGNLLDNAMQWARGRVLLQLREADGRLDAEVHDDGPGIAAAERDRVLARGERLDEAQPGSGLGLTIVDELARLYGGRLALDDSVRLGGLRAHLLLPAPPGAAAPTAPGMTGDG